MVDLLDRRYLTLKEAAAILPGRPHVSSLHRWRTRGVRGVRLCTQLAGGRRVVEIAELERFLDAVSAAGDGQSRLDHGSEKHHHDQRADQTREAQRVERVLDAEGF